MEITLTPELEEIVKGKVESGQYLSASDVVRNALEALLDEEVIIRHRVAGLRKLVAVGQEQIQRGEGKTYDSMDDLMDDIKARREQRLADQRAFHHSGGTLGQSHH
jgi:antitoxin ParD1/3/4